MARKARLNFEPKIKQIKLNWVYPSDLKTHFATNIVVQHQDDHFILSFFEVWPPPIIGDAEERNKLLESINEIDANCIARIVVTPEKMKDFIRVLEENTKKFTQKRVKERNRDNE